MHIAEPSLQEHSCFEVEITFEKLKRHKLPCSDQIQAELIHAIHEIH
jgi:hypothetical protein